MNAIYHSVVNLDELIVGSWQILLFSSLTLVECCHLIVNEVEETRP